MVMPATFTTSAPTTPSTPGTKDIDQLVATLRNDPSLHVFLSDHFSPQAHVGAAVLAQRVQPALQDAQRASTVLSASVRQHVIRRKEALLAEVEAVDALEKEVSSVSCGVSALVIATTELSDALDTPHVPMRNTVHRVTNIAQAANLVTALQRFRICTDRLSDAGLFPTISATDGGIVARHLPAAAEAVRELEELLESTPSLEKVEGLARDIVSVRKANMEVRKRAASLLKASLTERNQTDVEASVLAFHALGVLQERVSTEVARLARETQAAVHRGLETPSSLQQLQRQQQQWQQQRNQGKSSQRSSLPLSSSSFHNDVWDSIDRMLSVVADSCFKAILLQHVLSRKYCPITHLSLLYDTVASSFIDTVSRCIAEQVSILARTRVQRPGAAQVFLVLAEGYPRLRALLKDVSTRVSALARVSPVPIMKMNTSSSTSLSSAALGLSTSAGGTNKMPMIPDHDFIERSLLNAVMEVETHYFTASLERLTKTVNTLFDDGHQQPGETEALNFTKILAAELAAARIDRQLKRTAVSNVATAIRLYTSQAEDYAAVAAPDNNNNGDMNKSVMNNGGNPENAFSEWHLSTMYNGMVTLATSAGRVLGDGDDGSGQVPPSIAKELSTLTKLSDLLLDGPFSACRSNIRRVLQRMHTEDLEGVGSPSTKKGLNQYGRFMDEIDESSEGCSVYVLDMSAQLSMFADNVIPALARSRCLGTYTLELAKWVLDSFTAHVALVFPQTRSEIKMRLSTDMARIELAVEALCPARLLGKSFRALRALRACILLQTEDLIDLDPAALRHVRDLPMSTLAHVLLGRCSDPLLIHPHRRLDQTPGQYVEWLEKRSEDDAWKSVQESLNVYTLRKDPNNPDVMEFDAITSLSRKLQN